MIASSEVFLDTNILLYAALGRDHAGHRWERAREIVLSEDYCTSCQVLAEFYETVTGQRVRWEVISRHPRQSPASAWTGTEIRFDLSRRASPGTWRGLPHAGEPMTVLEFHHLGWDPHSEYLGFCSQAWAETLVLLRRWAESHPERPT